MKHLPFARAVHNFIFEEQDPAVFGVFRIALSLFLLLYYIALAPQWFLYYGPGGIAESPVKTWSEYQLFDSLLFFLRDPQVLALWYLLSLTCTVALLLGVLGKFPILWLWISNFSITYKNLGVVNSEEQVLAFLLLFALFLPLNESLGLRSTGRQSVTTWAHRPIQIHLLFVYVYSVVLKLTHGATWWDGTAVYYATQSLIYARWPGLPLFHVGNAFFARIATWITMSIEVLAPLLIWSKPLRTPLTLAAIALHLLMFVFLDGVGFFSLTFAIGFLLFFPGETVRKWVNWLYLPK